MKNLVLLLLALIYINQNIFAQDEYTIDTNSVAMEVFLIDAYVKQEPPYIFILSFYTSDVCLSNVVIDGKYEYVVSNGLSEAHSAKIDITSLKFLERNINFVIETTDSNGNKYSSEQFEFDLPYEPVISGGSSIWTLCLFAGSVFVLPMPGYVTSNGNHNYSLTKEIPIISFRAKKGNYPSSYLSLEYTHIFEAENQNYFRLGYKKIYTIDYLSLIHIYEPTRPY